MSMHHHPNTGLRWSGGGVPPPPPVPPPRRGGLTAPTTNQLDFLHHSMFNSSRLKSGITALAALLLVTSVLGAFAGGAAAAPVTTTGDLAGDGTDQITKFNASDDRNHTVTYETENTSGTLDDYDELSLEISHNNYTYATYDQTDVTVVSGGGDSTTTLEVEFQINHSDLEKLPGDAGVNTTTNYTITERESGATVDRTTEFAVDYEFADSYAVRHVHDAENQAIASHSEDDGYLMGLFGADSHATIEDDVGIAGDNTTITVYSDDSNITDEFDTSLDGADDGERVGTLMSSTLGDEVVYVFANEPGETISGDNVTDSDTYIVANENGEYTVHLGDEYQDENTVSMSLVGNQKFDRADLRNDLDYSFTQSWGLTFPNVMSFDWAPNPFTIAGDLGNAAGAGASLALVGSVAARRRGA